MKILQKFSISHHITPENSLTSSCWRHMPIHCLHIKLGTLVISWNAALLTYSTFKPTLISLHSAHSSIPVAKHTLAGKKHAMPAFNTKKISHQSGNYMLTNSIYNVYITCLARNLALALGTYINSKNLRADYFYFYVSEHADNRAIRRRSSEEKRTPQKNPKIQLQHDNRRKSTMFSPYTAMQQL